MMLDPKAAAALDDIAPRSWAREPSDWADVVRRAAAGDPAPRAVSRRRRAVALIVLAAASVLALPALAFSERVGGLFGFANDGEPVPEANVGLEAATALETTGATAGVVLLASRGGVGVYRANSPDGRVCYFVGPPGGRLSRGLSGGCLNAAASAGFPSPEQPVVDMTSFVYRPGDPGETVARLAGVAADGVATVRVLGHDCRVLAEARVVENVFVQTSIPDEQAVGIVALDHGGKRVHLQEMRGWNDARC